MPKRFSTLRVSIVCKAGTSTRNSECSGLKGMSAVMVEWRGVAWVPCVASGWCFGVRERAVLSWVGGGQLLRQREDRAMIGDMSGGNKAIG